jgi:predicted NUDIX family NTP pyrophosphohydrolase
LTATSQLFRVKRPQDCRPFHDAANYAAAELPARFKPRASTIDGLPKSGKFREFPEIDRSEVFSLTSAGEKANDRQAPSVDRLVALRRGQAEQS